MLLRRCLILLSGCMFCVAVASPSLAASPVDISSIDQAPVGSAPLLSGSEGVTALSGRILATDGSPLASVVVSDGASRTVSDANGRYLLEDVAPGPSIVTLDGRAAVHGSTAAGDYGYYEMSVKVNAGATNRLPFVNWLTPIDHAHDVAFASPAKSDVVVTTPAVPLLELRIPAGSVITDPDGKPVTHIGLTQISIRRPPFPLPMNVNVPVYFTAQPGGSVISSDDGRWLGAQVVYPNYRHQMPRARETFWVYKPDDGGWMRYGSGRVTDDRRQVVPEPGTRIYAFTGAMQGGPPGPCQGPECPPPPPPPPATSPSGGDPVDLASGSFDYSHTDMIVKDVMPISVARSYTSADTGLHSFGVGMSSIYDMNLNSSDEYLTASLVLPGGSSVLYTRLPSSITSTCGSTCYTNAVYTTSTAGPYYNSTIAWNGQGWNLTRSDGTIFIFGDNSPLQAIQDRFGNRITLVRNPQGQYYEQLGNIVQVNTPNGHYIKFAYNNPTTPTLVTSATDDLGRTFNYTYDTQTNTMLTQVQDPDGGITKFTWLTSAPSYAQLQSITDPRGNTFITNTYQADLRVKKQVLADGTSTYQFNYTVGTNCTTINGINECNLIETDVTDPNQNVRKITFDSLSNKLSDKWATNNTNLEIDTYLCWYGDGSANPSACANNVGSGGPTGYVSDVVDGLGRDTHYTYDAFGNTTGVTYLFGTSGATPYSYTYSPTFNLLASATDPLSNTVTITRPEPLEEATAVTDALGHSRTLTYNAQGQVLTVTDALTAPNGPNTYTLGYSNGYLTTVTDPLGRSASTYRDAAGRPTQKTDALGNTWLTVWDPIDGASQSADPNGATTTINYDADGDLASIVDALTHTTSYTYSSRDQLLTRTDPDLYEDQFTQYDPNGNLQKAIDRKGQTASYTYDALNRISTKTYADGSVVTFTWDKGNRLSQVSDTAGNTISRFYDGLNNLLCETPSSATSCPSSAGTVTYTYDVASRRHTMTLVGQTQVVYTFDNANRLTNIVQGNISVIKTYDNDNRPATVTLPNGVVGTYSFDAASELTGISYAKGSTNVGTLTYTYDLAGRVATRGGTLFQSVLPTSVVGASYDPDNRLCAWNTGSGSCTSPVITWDKNGNLTGDGSHTYSWDARNRLIATSNHSGAYTYDALARRLTNNIGTTTTSYVYDFANVLQEQVAGTASANLLTGLDVDERFQRTIVGGGTSSPLTDALGSEVALANASGVVATSYAYDPYGNTTASGGGNSNPYKFTGRENDNTGLYYYRARYYNSTWGRFISEDPIGFAGGINKYAYVVDSPLDYRDSGGMSSCKDADSKGPGQQLPELPDPPFTGPPELADLLSSSSGAAESVEAPWIIGMELDGIGFWDGGNAISESFLAGALDKQMMSAVDDALNQAASGGSGGGCNPPQPDHPTPPSSPGAK